MNALESVGTKYPDFQIYKLSAGEETQQDDLFILPLNNEILIFADDLDSVQAVMDTYIGTKKNIDSNAKFKSKLRSLRQRNDIFYWMEDAENGGGEVGLSKLFKDISFFYLGFSKANEKYKCEILFFMKSPDKNPAFISLIKFWASQQDEGDKDWKTVVDSLRYSDENEYVLITAEFSPALITSMINR